MPGRAMDEDIADGVDLRTIWFAFRRRLVLFGVIVAQVCVVTVLINAQLDEYYTAEARVLLDPRERRVLESEAVMTGLGNDAAAVETELQIIVSAALLGRVVDELGLVRDPEFNTFLGRDPSIFDVIGDHAERTGRSGLTLLSGTLADETPENQNAAAVSDPVLDGGDDAQTPDAADPNRADATPSFATQRQMTIAILRSRVSARRVGKSYIIRLGVTSRHPEKAAQIANKIAQQYEVDQMEAKLDATRRANTWITEQLETASDELQRAEAEVARLRLELGIPAGATGDDGVSLSEQELVELSAQLVVENTQLQERRSRLDTLRRELAAGRSVDDFPDIVQSQTITELRFQRGQITGELSANQNRGQNHPQVRRLNRELVEVNQRIDEEVARLVAALENEVRVSAQRVRNFEQSIAGLRAELGDKSEQLLALRDLERRVEARRFEYRQLLSRGQETDLMGTLEESQARVMMVARPPLWPSAPNRDLNLIIGLVLGVALGGFGVFVAEAFDSGLRTPVDAQRFLGVRCLALLPRVRIPGKSGKPGVVDMGEYVIQRPMSAYAEALRALRASIVMSQDTPDPRVMAFVSSLSGEGKTSTALSFARVAAMQGAKVVAIDFDLRRRELTRAARLQPECGLADVLSGQEPASAVLADDTAETGLKILPLASGKFAPSGMADLSRVQELLVELRKDFDLVVIDSAPILAVTETRVLAAHVDAVVFVAQWRSTPRNAVRAGLETLASVHAPLAGLALTQVNMAAQGKYEHGAGYYSRQYAKYYHD